MTEHAKSAGDRFYDLIATYPGLHLRELARQANLSEALAGYHARQCLDRGLVETLHDGYYLRFFVAKGSRPRDPDREIVMLLRHRVPLQVVLFLLEHSTATHGELTAHLGLPKANTSYHVSKLVAAKILVAGGESRGFRLREPAHIRHLLDRWRPPTVLAENFEELWHDLYGGKGPRVRGPAKT